MAPIVQMHYMQLIAAGYRLDFSLEKKLSNDKLLKFPVITNDSAIAA
jgi:hypothetical protein